MGSNLAPCRRKCQTPRAASVPSKPRAARDGTIRRPAAGGMLLASVCRSPRSPARPTNVIDLGPFTVHIYGLCYALAVSRRSRSSAADGRRRAARATSSTTSRCGGFRPASSADGSTSSRPPRRRFRPLVGPVRVWEGGLGIWGGIALGTLVGLWRVNGPAPTSPLHRRRAPALLVAQAIGRIGNYFNQELFGRPTDLPWALEIDPEHRPDRYATEPTFHPTFLYELLWNLGSPPRWSGSGTTVASDHPACSHCTSPATAPFASWTSSARRPRRACLRRAMEPAAVDRGHADRACLRSRASRPVGGSVDTRRRVNG